MQVPSTLLCEFIISGVLSLDLEVFDHLIRQCLWGDSSSLYDVDVLLIHGSTGRRMVTSSEVTTSNLRGWGATLRATGLMYSMRWVVCIALLMSIDTAIWPS